MSDIANTNIFVVRIFYRPTSINKSILAQVKALFIGNAHKY